MSKTVADLTVEEAVQLLREVSYAEGLHQAALRLLYHLLVTAEHDSNVLVILTERVDSLADDATAVALTEYLVNVLPAGANKDKVEFLRVHRLRRLGLLEDEDRLDSKRFAELIRQATGGSELRSVFEFVRTLIGVRAGLLRHKSPGETLPIDMQNSTQFENTEDYYKFLSAQELSCP